jgi:hypothetical protein
MRSSRGLDIPLGTQGAELLDTRYYDEDPEDAMAASDIDNDDDEEIIDDPEVAAATTNGSAHRSRLSAPVPPRLIRPTAAPSRIASSGCPATCSEEPGQ